MKHRNAIPGIAAALTLGNLTPPSLEAVTSMGRRP
jgi:hypothetical protein